MSPFDLCLRRAGAALLAFVALSFADEVLLLLYDDVGLAARWWVRAAIYSALGVVLIFRVRWSAGIGVVVCGWIALGHTLGLYVALATNFLSFRAYPGVHLVLWVLRVLAILAAFVLIVRALRAGRSGGPALEARDDSSRGPARSGA
jgi:hypothetical protein